MTLLEVCVDSLPALARAQTRGAGRIEVCERLGLGGVSPSKEFLDRALATARLPLHIMVHPRGGGFVYSEVEFEQMKRDLQHLRDLPVAGAVFGMLLADQRIGLRRTRELVERARSSSANSTPRQSQSRVSLAGPMRCMGPGARAANSARIASPEVTIASQASRGARRRSSWRGIGSRGLGMLVMSTTRPPLARNRTSALAARSNTRCPLCTTPHRSRSTAS